MSFNKIYGLIGYDPDGNEIISVVSLKPPKVKNKVIMISKKAMPHTDCIDDWEEYK